MNHLLAIIALPFTVTVIIPGIVLDATNRINPGWSLQSPLNVIPAIVGLALVCAGLVLMYQTISLFVNVGKGTLAPWDPPKKFVVHGVYRYVRNPMISGVFCILLGEAIVFGSSALFVWFLVFVVINMIYMPLSEEPALERRFGEDYVLYKKNVPRWIPRFKPWELPSAQ